MDSGGYISSGNPKGRKRSAPAARRSRNSIWRPTHNSSQKTTWSRFLLENSLGAWWAARHPDSPLVKEFQYLRFREDGTPAPGTFQDWPERAANVTVMDPCCGSAHFLVVAFEMLRRMRMEEEGLSDAKAANAVIRDNVHGLEIDPRCVQIAAFALALAAWKTGGFHELPLPNVACSGIPVQGQLEAWKKLAEGDGNLERTLEKLHGLFVNAPDLGSLINPADIPVRDRMFAPDFERIAPLLEQALATERSHDPVASAFGRTALGVARAAKLMIGKYTLVTTNVPYLTRQKQGDHLRTYINARFPEAKANLATAFLSRCRELATSEGTYAVVILQNWLFQPAYRKLRTKFLHEQQWVAVARLGPGAFDSVSGEVVNVVLSINTNSHPRLLHRFLAIDVNEMKGAQQKARGLVISEARYFDQAQQLLNPDTRIITEPITTTSLMGKFAHSRTGTRTADNPRFVRMFWEIDSLNREWEPFQSTASETSPYSGREKVILWQSGIGELAEYAQLGLASIQGQDAWNKKGIVVSLTGSLPATLYLGDKFDMNCGVIWPKDQDDLEAIWAYCSSPEFNRDIRQIDRQLKLTTATLLKVPFDIDRWSKVASETNGLPEPQIRDATQWLFSGSPIDGFHSLQVAVARLLGYRWPKQGSDRLSQLAISDGILPLSPSAGQEPASERLRRVLNVAYGDDWSTERQRQLLLQVGFAEKGLDAWLRDGFFEQHCKIFHQRPFIWHIWDGRKDGFSALVNYHEFDSTNLDRLIYTYLGDWIRTQQSAEDSGTSGANARLVAALELQKKLEAIRDGEDPYDIHVRWKPVHEQPIGWDPDLNYGVRLNIRPFITAGVLRCKVKVNWDKDRGRGPDGSERINDLHFGLAEKQAAREAQKA